VDLGSRTGSGCGMLKIVEILPPGLRPAHGSGGAMLRFADGFAKFSAGARAGRMRRGRAVRSVGYLHSGFGSFSIESGVPTSSRFWTWSTMLVAMASSVTNISVACVGESGWPPTSLCS